jgi:hypothetical protein
VRGETNNRAATSLLPGLAHELHDFPFRACQRRIGPCCLEVVVPHHPRATVNIVVKDDNLPSLLLNVSAVPLRT